TPQKLIKILQTASFNVIRQKGSHVIMIDDRKTRIVIPVHPEKDIKPGLSPDFIRYTAPASADRSAPPILYGKFRKTSIFLS
ncbi:addiction module toxin, HicA family, partial [archaeon]|nr:addiction module toxin, HicA family [archaeon]